MGEIKPVGSEKLQGNEKMKRILELTYYDNKKDVNHVSANYEYLVETVNGVYGIVKEKDGYYVKMGLNENTLDYIGGLFMKNKNRFSSYPEALKRLNLLKGQENIQEATKYVLKTKPTQSAPAEPPVDTTPAPAPENVTAPDENPMPDENPTPEGGMGDKLDLPTSSDDDMDSEDNESGLKIIQKLTGRLGEKIRSSEEELESKDLKYILNSIISAIDLNKLDEEDLDDVLANFDLDKEGDFDGDSEEIDDEPSFDEEIPTDGTPTEDELGEMQDLENLINTEFEFDPDDDFENTKFDDDEIEGDEEIYDPIENERKSYQSPSDRMYDSDDWVKARKDELGIDEEDENISAYLATTGDNSNDEDIDSEIFEDDEFDETSVREFDIDEIKNIVNKVIKDNLQNYFK